MRRVRLFAVPATCVLFLTTSVPDVLAQPSKGAGKIAVSVGGLRVVGPGYGEDGTEERPFNAGAGTTLVLVLKAPKGVGLIEIEDDDSRIDAVTDDKGTDLRVDADFGSFPDITKDGSVGLIELELESRPAAGASNITLEGSIAVTTATGTKLQKASNVALAAEKGFKLAGVAMTVASAEQNDEGWTVTINLPRSALNTLKALRFKDGKGAEIEADRTGSGYFNDVGEMSYRIKTPAKSVNIEADVWQGLKAEQVPFKLTAGLGL